MADEQKPLIIYTTENFEMTALLKELEEKKVEIIYLREVLQTKEEEIKTLRAANAKLEASSKLEAVKRKRHDSTEEHREIPTKETLVSTRKVQKTEPNEPNKQILKSNNDIKSHLCNGNSTRCNNTATHKSQQSKLKDLSAETAQIHVVKVDSLTQSSSNCNLVPYKVTRNTLSHIHERYQRVLDVVNEEGCSNRQAYKIAGIPRSTVRDMIGIAELYIVDQHEFDLVLKDTKRGSSVKAIERACRRKLGEKKEKMSALRAQGKLLPIIFNDEFYNCTETVRRK